MNHDRIVFITGANRGIGLEYAQQLSQRGDTVIAGYRTEGSSTKLLDLAARHDNFFAVKVDVTVEADLVEVRDFIASKFGRLDMLVSNAGINLQYSTPLDEVGTDEIMENFRVNVIGPFLAAKILRPLLDKGTDAKIINISSQMGSISRTSGNATPYRISKAAVNMLAKHQAIAYADAGITTIALHPGWVKTDMGGSEAPLTPTDAVTKMLTVIDGLAADDNGAFLSYTGETIEY